MPGINALPREQEALKIRQGNRLNLRAQPVDRQPMNPGQKPAVAPFEFCCVRMKTSA